MSRGRLLLIPLQMLLVSHARAWPPLSIDDPNILDAGQLELILATTATTTDPEDYYQLPLLDMSLGLIQDHVQLSLVVPYVHSNPHSGASARDFGNPEIGVKWRFLNRDKLQLAFAPFYGFAVSREVAAKGIGIDSNYAAFPINAEYQIDGRWRLNGEVGYFSFGGEPDRWGYGTALAYRAWENCDFLFELAGSVNNDFDEHVLEGRMGFDLTLNRSLHLLFAVATGIRAPAEANDINLDIFLGLQYLYPGE